MNEICGTEVTRQDGSIIFSCPSVRSVFEAVDKVEAGVRIEDPKAFSQRVVRSGGRVSRTWISVDPVTGEQKVAYRKPRFIA